MKRNTVNFIGAAAALVLLVLLFVPFFHFTAGEQKVSCSVAHYAWQPAATKDVQNYIKDQLGSAAPTPNDFSIPIVIFTAVTLATLLIALMMNGRKLPDIFILLTGFAGLWALLSDKPLALGGIVTVLLYMISAAMLLFGALLTLKDFSLTGAHEGTIYIWIMAACVALIAVSVFPVSFTASAVSMTPAGLSADSVLRYGDSASALAGDGTLISPVCMMAIPVIVLLVGIFLRGRCFMPWVFAAVFALCVYALLSDAVYNDIPFSRAGALAGAMGGLTVSLLLTVSRVLRPRSEVKGEKAEPKRFIRTITDIFGAVLILVIMICVFSAVITPISLRIEPAGIADNPLDPYVLEPLDEYLGNTVYLTPSLLFMILFVTFLLCVFCAGKDFLAWAQMIAGAAALFGLLTNPVYAANGARSVALIFSVLLLLSGAASFILTLKEYRGEDTKKLNIYSLVIVLITVIMLILPCWNVRDAQQDGATVSLAGVFTMRADQIMATTNASSVKKMTRSGTTVAKMLKKSQYKDMLLSDALKDPDTLTWIADGVESISNPHSLLEEKITYETRRRMELNGISANKAEEYVANVRSLTVIPVIILILAAVYCSLFALKRDQSWIAIIAFITALTGLLLFALPQELHYSNLYLIFIALYFILLLISAKTCFSFIREKKAEADEFNRTVFGACKKER